MGKKIILLLCSLLFVALLPLVSSQAVEQEIETFTFGENITFVETIRFNGRPNSGIEVNLTVTDPDNAVLINFEPMAFDAASQTYKFTMDSGNISEVGVFKECVTATFNGINDTVCGEFEVTRTGTILRTSSGLVYAAVFFASIFAFILSTWAFLRVEWKDHRNEEHKIVGISGYKYLKVLMFFISYLILLFIFSIGNDMASSFLLLQGAGQFFRISYLVLLVGIAPGVIVTFAFLIINILSDQKIQKAIIRGVPIQR